MTRNAIVGMFDTWARDGRDRDMQEAHGDVVRQAIERMEIRPGERVLDLGCGNGWATRLLARAAEGVVAIGVDASAAMIARAESDRGAPRGVQYAVASFEHLPLSAGSVDRVFSMEALYYAVDLDAAVGELRRVIVDGGRADVLIDYFVENPASEHWAEVTGADLHRLDADGWRAVFERGGFGAVTIERLYDRREVDASPCDACEPTAEIKAALRAAGTMWIHAGAIG
jgi:SAM-dependent methyltransferase